MNGSSVEIYADRHDLELLFKLLNSIGEFKFVQSLSDLNQNPRIYENAENLSQYQVDYENPNPKSLFLCLSKSASVNSRELSMKDGSNGIKFKTDEVFNPSAISILLGGEAASDTIVQTVISSAYYSEAARKKLLIIRKLIDKVSTKVNSFRVMPSSYKKLLKGQRLTQGIDYNRDYDLKLS
ncbi:hypothetical protein [Thalassotalea agarivorans]|uniref:Uncharacterized protein n=1 Tax=Thalassotalea agarivorans TaxID=349064 RepID=A0A1I0C1D0_THASX|nr:hypothetical protein [Thalassotalea agarivorans]SET13284.1 hypothetical protein SAMN05660429_01133 [Thalassotalea agarivorans]